MQNLFQASQDDERLMTPLAARIRPKSLDEIIGQEHLIGPGKIIRKQIEQDRIFSSIFWGPPGSGKTTLAMLMARETKSDFVRLSAVGSGVADVRKVLDAAEKQKSLYRRKTILFIDEVHRFNKAQQDVLLPAVESGIVVFIGATTENPSYEVIPPLRSRSRTLRLHPLTPEQVMQLIDRALSRDEVMRQMGVQLPEDAREFLAHLANGDGRQALNILEIAASLADKDEHGKTMVTADDVAAAAQKRATFYDKSGDRHYDTISAFIKSVRGSDPDAALVWLARMLTAGEDPIFIARRLLILASEDIGNADPMGLVVAASGAKAVEMVGMPEANLILAQVTTYLACAEKSNASCVAIGAAEELLETMGDKLSVPLHLRDSSFAAAKATGYGVGYKYPHSFDGHWVKQDYLPEGFLDKELYRPTEMGAEAKLAERLRKIKKARGFEVRSSQFEVEGESSGEASDGSDRSDESKKDKSDGQAGGPDE